MAEYDLKGLKENALGGYDEVVLQASAVEIDTGTEVAKVATPKNLKDSKYQRIHIGETEPTGDEDMWFDPTEVPGGTLTKATASDINTGTDDAKYVTPKAVADSNVGKVLQIASQTLAAANWTSGTTYKEYALSNANITVNSIVEIIPDNEDLEVVKVAEILPVVVSSAGAVTIYAINIPTTDIGVTLNITTKQS